MGPGGGLGWEGLSGVELLAPSWVCSSVLSWEEVLVLVTGGVSSVLGAPSKPSPEDGGGGGGGEGGLEDSP